MFDFQCNDLAPLSAHVSDLPNGLVAVGGDLSPHRLLEAYSLGIFPWNDANQPILWWSPDPRMVLFPDDLYVSKSLKRLIKQEIFEVRFDTQFEAVMRACAQTLRNGENETWITPALMESFIKLNAMGLAHSVETYFNGELVGGLYGLAIGSIFFGESMFYAHSNASKVAFVHLVNFLKANKFDLIDAQQDTQHLGSLGAKTISKEEFLRRIQVCTTKPSLIGQWNSGNCLKKIIELK